MLVFDGVGTSVCVSVIVDVPDGVLDTVELRVRVCVVDLEVVSEGDWDFVFCEVDRVKVEVFDDDDDSVAERVKVSERVDVSV